MMDVNASLSRFKAIMWEDKLRRKFKGKPASEKGLKVCCKCGACCHTGTCAISLEDLNHLAARYKLPPSDFFRRFCMVDEIGDVPHTVRLRRSSQADIAGQWIPTDRTFDSDPCVLWDKTKGCTVYKDRPENARSMVCWDPSTGTVPKWKCKDIIALGWDGKKNDD
jgi:Fe-S-cluster containining protein